MFPPLLRTHGAEFDATKRAWTESYRPQAGSRVIVPAGRRRYVINWHGKQLLPAQAAFSAFDREMQGLWIGLRMKLRHRRDAWIAADHSMGGHRTLVLSTIFPEVLIAALSAMEWRQLDQYGSGSRREEMKFEDSALWSLLSVASFQWGACTRRTGSELSSSLMSAVPMKMFSVSSSRPSVRPFPRKLVRIRLDRSEARAKR